MKNKLITALLITLSFSASANQDCRAIGDKAEKIMKTRQAFEDVFKTLDKYKDDSAIVLDAYKSEQVNTTKNLFAAVQSSGNERAMYMARHKDDVSKQNAIISAFKMKYIASCLRGGK